MTLFSFTLSITGADVMSADAQEALFNAGCDDATFGVAEGVQTAEFDREANEFAEAVASASKAVEATVLGATVVEVMRARADTSGPSASRPGTFSVVGFAVSADAYDQFMGRYSVPLGPVFADFAGVARGQRILDVGCGPGALTGELVRRLGSGAVVAVDPSASFVDAVRDRLPHAEVHRADAEHLPLADDTFDTALAQLVVHFMTDPVGGLREMGRVTKPGGVVAACVWDFGEGGSPLSLFWEAAQDLDVHAPVEAALPGTRRGQLALLLREAGVGAVEETALSIEVRHDTFEDWWQPFEFGVGPAGSYVSALGSLGRKRLEERCRELLPESPFVVTAVAWAARGSVTTR